MKIGIDSLPAIAVLPARGATSTGRRRSATIMTAQGARWFPEDGDAAMTDVDVLRRLMLLLEDRQLSPRQVVVLHLHEEAETLNLSLEEVADGLDHLLAIDYIDGPGIDEEGFFLFRKLTRRGIRFVQAARRPADWARLKKQYSGLAIAPRD